jgi:capsule polysaccharide export protein KpsE/RkpR
MGAGVAAILAMLVHSGDADVLAAAEKAAKEAEAKRKKADGGGDDFRERAEADG